MQNSFRKDALLRTLREDYGITDSEQFLEALRKMKKLDIAQFVLTPETRGEKQCTRQFPEPAMS